MQTKTETKWSQIFTFGFPNSKIETTSGKLPYIDWLKREQARISSTGRATRIVRRGKQVTLFAEWIGAGKPEQLEDPV